MRAKYFPSNKTTSKMNVLEISLNDYSFRRLRDGMVIEVLIPMDKKFNKPIYNRKSISVLIGIDVDLKGHARLWSDRKEIEADVNQKYIIESISELKQSLIDKINEVKNYGTN